MGPWSTRTSWILLASGVLLLPVFHTVVPLQVDGSMVCDDELPRGLVPIQGTQFGSADIHYDAANDTTLLTPGCGHGSSHVAFPVKGDHRGLKVGDRMVLWVQNASGPHPLPAGINATDEWRGEPITGVWGGTYTPLPHWPLQVFPPIAGLLVGLGSWRFQQRPVPVPEMAVGGVVGGGVGAVLGGMGLVAVLGTLFVSLILLVAFTTWRNATNPWVVRIAGAVCLACLFVFAGIAFTFAFTPQYPAA